MKIFIHHNMVDSISKQNNANVKNNQKLHKILHVITQSYHISYTNFRKHHTC